MNGADPRPTRRKNGRTSLSNSKKKRRSGQQPQDDPQSPRKRRFKKFLKIAIILLILFAIIRYIIAIYRWRLLAKDMLLNKTSVVLDIDENKVATLGGNKKKIALSSSEIQQNIKDAYVAIEDERFYKHHGIDAKRTGSAIVTYITHFGKSGFGGSTITQQLVKNMTGDNSDKATRKIKEWWRAWELESCSSKDDILTAYLNMIYTGPNIYGVEAGANYYFNKPSSELSLEECAFLAGINNSPNSYNPFGENNDPEKITKRTKTVLNKMKDLDYISNSEYDEAIKRLEAGLNFEKGELESDDSVYSYHTDALINELTQDMAKKYNISNEFATNYLENAGLTIYSTLDVEVQEELDTEFEKSKYILDSIINDSHSQAAMVIIDQNKGYVVACRGGLGEKDEARPLNRATQSVRQTGSAMKPLAVLAPALEKKITNNAAIYDDTERDFEDGYHPTDYNTPLGKVTLRRAVESSQNVPFVEIMEELTPKQSIKYMKKMGITTLTKDDESLALALRWIRQRYKSTRNGCRICNDSK
ncbi:MAG: penicillin-binding protein [Clostridia bacterium]|nr:penicillin-binding protein [Clostridia bacterium]